MSHAYHEKLPNYNPDSILHDGCEECEDRGNAGLDGLLELDHKNAQRAAERMIAWQMRGELRPTDDSEARLLKTVYLMFVWLERFTTLDPLNQPLPWKDFDAMERALCGPRAA